MIKRRIKRGRIKRDLFPLKHLPVKEHVTPARFKAYGQRAERKGFLYVASGPLVRSSYKAAEFYIEGMLRRRRGEASEDKS